MSNACILCFGSGESGAGKTESTKHILQYLSDMSKSAAAVTDGIKVEEAILQSRYAYVYQSSRLLA